MLTAARSTPSSQQLTVDQSTFTDKQAKGGGGGAIFAAGAVVVTRSLLSGNSAPADIGGAISDMTPGGVQLTDSTLTGNSSASSGGAIAGAHGVLTNDTIVGNSAQASGGNIDGTPTLLNTIVAAGSAPSRANCDSHVTSSGHNLEDANTCGFTAARDQINTNPKLGTLQNNGGPTETMALLAGSPAIDKGSNSGWPATDERGVGSPQGAACDIGAYEVAPPFATTGPATAVKATSATLTAAVRNPDAVPASMVFQYGTTTGYGSKAVAAATPYSAGSTLSAALSSLTPKKTYDYRVIVSNPDGTSVGTDRTFTTPLPSNRFSFKGHKVASSGKLTIKLGTPNAGVVKAKATFKFGTGKHGATSP